ncbi:MAG: hypothetical protein J7K02_12555, partial [Deltaproteobacteria bacterium]|nr:hypothetical protein [Deltaproteobacteria bacterium]
PFYISCQFDALTSKRAYKEPFSLEKSFGIIKEGRGNHFDPDVMAAFFAIEDEILAIKGISSINSGNDSRYLISTFPPVCVRTPVCRATAKAWRTGRRRRESMRYCP